MLGGVQVLGSIVKKMLLVALSAMAWKCLFGSDSGVSGLWHWSVSLPLHGKSFNLSVS